MGPLLNAIKEKMGLGLPGMNTPANDGGVFFSSDQRGTSLPPVRLPLGLPLSTGDLVENMQSKQPTPGSQSGVYVWNPGEFALRYSQRMNAGNPPDELAKTAAEQDWMQQFKGFTREQVPPSKLEYPIPTMEHQALGVEPGLYKLYNQIGGASAYDGSAGYSAPSVTTPLDQRGPAPYHDYNTNRRPTGRQR